MSRLFLPPALLALAAALHAAEAQPDAVAAHGQGTAACDPIDHVVRERMEAVPLVMAIALLGRDLEAHIAIDGEVFLHTYAPVTIAGAPKRGRDLLLDILGARKLALSWNAGAWYVSLAMPAGPPQLQIFDLSPFLQEDGALTREAACHLGDQAAFHMQDSHARAQRRSLPAQALVDDIRHAVPGSWWDDATCDIQIRSRCLFVSLPKEGQDMIRRHLAALRLEMRDPVFIADGTQK